MKYATEHLSECDYSDNILVCPECSNIISEDIEEYPSRIYCYGSIGITHPKTEMEPEYTNAYNDDWTPYVPDPNAKQFSFVDLFINEANIANMIPFDGLKVRIKDD